MSTINAKFMHNKLKNGWTAEDFAEHLNVTADEFLENLQKIFSANAYRGMLADLKQNQKRKEKKMKKDSEEISTSEKIEEVKNITETTSVSDNSSDENIISDESPDNFSESNLLDSLRKTEERLVLIVCQEEAKHSQLITTRHDIAKRAETKKSELLRLQNIIKKYSTEVTEMSEKFLEISAQIQELNIQLSEHQAQLEEVRQNIRILEKPVIFVYDNGEIETENAKTVIPENWTDVFGEIVNKDTVESLTIKQVKQLAKVVSFTRLLSQQNLDYDIEFENELVQASFETISNAA